MTEREKLIEELGKLGFVDSLKHSNAIQTNNELKRESWLRADLEEIADFILADRKRIVEPLVNVDRTDDFKLIEAINKTLKNANIS